MPTNHSRRFDNNSLLGHALHDRPRRSHAASLKRRATASSAKQCRTSRNARRHCFSADSEAVARPNVDRDSSSRATPPAGDDRRSVPASLLGQLIGRGFGLLVPGT